MPPTSGGCFNINMSSYQYKKSHCGDKMILRPSYLHNGISYTGKMISIYWIRAQMQEALSFWLVCLSIQLVRQVAHWLSIPPRGFWALFWKCIEGMASNLTYWFIPSLGSFRLWYSPQLSCDAAFKFFSITHCNQVTWLATSAQLLTLPAVIIVKVRTHMKLCWSVITRIIVRNRPLSGTTTMTSQRHIMMTWHSKH